jgi:hypothetical protein
MEDFELFKGKTLSNLFEDIYLNQINKKVKISTYIDELKNYIRHAGDVAVIGPIIKDLIDTSVKNDEQLVKLATIAQRIMISQNKGEGDSGFLTEAEKKQLLQQLDEVKGEVEDDILSVEKEIKKITKK